MRADIHGGPEYSTLQSETRYIVHDQKADRSTKVSCNARPHHTLGQRRRRRQRLSTAGLPSTAELLTDSQHLRSVPQTVIHYGVGGRQTRCLPFREAALEAPHGKTVFAQEGCGFEGQHTVWTSAISDDIALLGELAQPPSQFPATGY